MAKSKKPKGSKGPKVSKGSKSKSKGSKGKKGKGKKKTKSKKKIHDEPDEPPPPPDLNTFVYVRRQNLTLCLETHEEETIKELKIQVATILRQFPEDIALFAMLGKKEEEMEEKEKKKEEEKKDEKPGSRGRGANKEKVERSNSPPKPPGDMTVGKYGYNPRTASVFSPATIGLAYRGDDGEFEKVEITPYGEFPVIPEEIKMHLRNYVPPPPPPAKKGGGGGGNVKK